MVRFLHEWYKEREIMQKKVTEQKRNDCTRKQKNLWKCDGEKYTNLKWITSIWFLVATEGMLKIWM